MIVAMKKGATGDQVTTVVQTIQQFGYRVGSIEGEEETVIGAIGLGDVTACLEAVGPLPGVMRAVRISTPFKQVSLTFRPVRTVVKVGDVSIGGEELVVMAGPCAVENEEQIMAAAEAVKKAGAKILRGGAFKPRSSPYSFQGLGFEGLQLLHKARELTGLSIVTEVMSAMHVDLVSNMADIVQVGARNMRNYELLKELGRCRKPVLLKRAPDASITDLLLSAEYIVEHGNSDVILCERGIVTFDKEYTRNTCDICSISVLKDLTHLPVILDPSHACGRRKLVPGLARAGVAMGVDGLIIEVHPEPRKALSDGSQSLDFPQFSKLMTSLGSLREVWQESRREFNGTSHLVALA